jgi:hypothetical protein
VLSFCRKKNLPVLYLLVAKCHRKYKSKIVICIMSTIDLSKYAAYLTNNDIYSAYPAAFVSDKLRAPTAKKAKSLRIESLIYNIMNPKPEWLVIGLHKLEFDNG